MRTLRACHFRFSILPNPLRNKTSLHVHCKSQLLHKMQAWNIKAELGCTVEQGPRIERMTRHHAMHSPSQEVPVLDISRRVTLVAVLHILSSPRAPQAGGPHPVPAWTSLMGFKLSVVPS